MAKIPANLSKSTLQKLIVMGVLQVVSGFDISDLNPLIVAIRIDIKKKYDRYPCEIRQPTFF